MRVGDGVIMQTDRQLQHPLLCADCEEILNKNGETWVNPKLATVKDGFPLYEILIRRQAAAEDEAGGIYFAVENGDIDVEKLTHFALGIFWKAAVHSWKGKERSPMIELGPYADRIRVWLRSESPFPRNVSLSVMLARADRALVAFTGPVERPPKVWRTFWLYVPGISFVLSVGRLIEAEMRETCIHENPTHPIFVADDVMGAVWTRLKEQYQESRKTRGYLEAKVKRSLKQES